MFLRLTYNRASDCHEYASVLGDPEAIRDLYWQLTHNYHAKDGTQIGKIKVYDLFGSEILESQLLTRPFSVSPTITSLPRY